MEAQSLRWTPVTTLTKELSGATAISQAGKCVGCLTFGTVEQGLLVNRHPRAQTKSGKVLGPRSRHSR